jgi:hypothetical protein
MSVQLILYPQHYDGQYNSISADQNEFVVNGISFVGLDSASSYDLVTTSIYDVIPNAPPTITNTWYRFRSTAFGTPALPTVTSGNLVLNSTTTLTLSGVYQNLANLTIGQLYNVTIIIPTPASMGGIYVMAWNGTSLISSQVFDATLSQVNASFTANATNVTLMLYFYNTVADNVTISSVSVLPSGVLPSDAINILDNGQVICDLYEDEDIPLSLSIDDFKNVAEQVQSYSKAFNLPATKRNNKIFNQMYEITRSDDGIIFNPYVKTQCVLKQDGFLLFEGYMRMLDITDKGGEISYNVNLYSEVVALADVLEDRTFSDLDFTELEHDYNKTQIKYSWNNSGTGITYLNPSTSGFRDANDTVKYPFVDWNHQWVVGGSGTGTLATVGNPELTSLEQAFRPFIQVRYLIDRIFNAPNTPFSYTSSFIGGGEFTDLYMDFNWGADNSPVVFGSSGVLTRITDQSLTTSYTTLEFQDNPSPVSVIPTEFGYSSGVFTVPQDGQFYSINYNMEFKTLLTAVETLDIQWVVNGIPTQQQTQTVTSAGYTYSGSFTAGITPLLTAGDTILCQAKSSGTTMDLESGLSGSIPLAYDNLVTATTSSDQTTNDMLLQTLRGELGQWDFLKGIMTMFNLVTMVDPDNPNNLLIEPYSDVFITDTAGTNLASRGVEHDWTDKIDVSEMKLVPLTDLNKKTIFKFVEDDDDFCFRRYREQVGGHLYGSKKYDASGFTVLTGEDEIVAEPFAATIIKPLMPQFQNFITPAIYAKNDDGTEGFENSPRIMWNNGIKDTGVSYYIPAQNGLNSENQDDFLQFSHLTDIPAVAGSTQDYHFGECQLAGGITSVTDNLFNLYWLPYYAQLYNPNTRTMTIKVNLNAGDISTFKFNDKVMLKNRVFRVNKIDYKPNDLATVEFLLVP